MAPGDGNCEDLNGLCSLRAAVSEANALPGEQEVRLADSATYPLARYRDAIEHAANAGSRGAVKIAFDLRNERERESL